jgi:hypothetical protein
MAQSPPSTNVTANFPFPLLTPFATDLSPPTHTTLRVLQKEMNANAISVHSNDGGGRHGHLTLTISAVRYLVVATVAFPAPVAPTIAPVIAAGASSAAIGEAVRQHQENVRVFQRYHDTDRALVRCIIAATPSTYIEALSHDEFGYATVTSLQLLTHLHTTYGVMTAADIDANMARMNNPWSPPTPIEVLFKQLEEGQRFATLAAEPIADSQLA